MCQEIFGPSCFSLTNYLTVDWPALSRGYVDLRKDGAQVEVDQGGGGAGLTAAVVDAAQQRSCRLTTTARHVGARGRGGGGGVRHRHSRGARIKPGGMMMMMVRVGMVMRHLGHHETAVCILCGRGEGWQRR